MTLCLLVVPWYFWLGLLAGLYLLVRGIILIIYGRVQWGIYQLAAVVLFYGGWLAWQFYAVRWAQYVLFVAILLLLVPLFMYPSWALRGRRNPPPPDQDKEQENRS